ncbi:hypothetical protein [Nucisporomicrobium flavum]|uniref:hypothetical protein n=1 Tax=Nucisporomicrobium flavum TaxID=2785915 RepID=UPI0018F5A96B|nr:hypothetical protein [Nucisporomicrobium flavum]
MRAILTRLRVAGMTAAAVVAAIPAPAGAAAALTVSDISFSTEHVDVRQAPALVELRFTVTGADPAASEISGAVWYAQFAGGRQIGPDTFVPYDAGVSGGGPVTIGVPLSVPQYGATGTAVWRPVKLTARDGYAGDLALEGAALEGAEVGVTQLVDSVRPVFHEVGLWPGQSPEVVDPGSGATVTYRVTVSDLQAGFWKGRLILAGPRGHRVESGFAVAFDGRHLTCGTDSLIEDVFDHVDCSVPVVVPAGTWRVARVVLTDQAQNRTTVRRPAAPLVTVS